MKIKNILITLSLLIVFVSALSAKNNEKFTGSLLWKISGNGLGQASYIVGTHHFFTGEFTDSIPGLYTAFDNSEQVIGELLLADFDTLEAKLLQATKMDDGITYHQLLSKKNYKKLDEGLKSLLGAGLDQLGVFNPSTIGIYLTRALYDKINPGYDPESNEAIDIYLQNLAVSRGKTTLGLETIEDQIDAVFDSKPTKDEAESILFMITHRKEVEESLRLVNQYYRSGNLEGLYKLSFGGPDAMSQEEQMKLITARNNNWLKQLPQTMEKASSLVVVGALHLPGKEGLLFQLNEMGYTVEAIK